MLDITTRTTWGPPPAGRRPPPTDAGAPWPPDLSSNPSLLSMAIQRLSLLTGSVRS
jgi:hypothetical protein